MSNVCTPPAVDWTPLPYGNPLESVWDLGASVWDSGTSVWDFEAANPWVHECSY